MLGAAREALPADRVSLRVAAIESELPAGPFDVVASALCVHHLEGALKRDLVVWEHGDLAVVVASAGAVTM